MDYTIRNTKGQVYKLVHEAASTRPKMSRLLPNAMSDSIAVAKVLNQAKPVSCSWAQLWQKMKPANTQALTNDAHIIQAIIALVTQKRVQLLPQTSQQHSPAMRENRTQLSHSGSDGSSGGTATGSHQASTHKEEAVLEPAVRKTAGHESAPPPVAKPCTEKNATQSSAEPEGGSTIANTQCEGDPVSMITGEEMLQFVDATLPGPMPFKWQRTYRSSQARDAGLGMGWSHSGSEYLHVQEDRLNYVDAEGRKIPFSPPKIHQRSKYLPEGLNLDRLSPDSYLLQQPGQWDKLFTRINPTSAHYQLTQIRHPAYIPEDSHREATGFCINLHYNARQRMTQIAGNWGYALSVKRNADDRVEQLLLEHSPTGQSRIVAHYAYNTDGDLIAQRDAKGAGEHYEYTNHLIVKRTLKTGFAFHFEWDGTDHTARCIHNWGDKGIYEYYFDWDNQNNSSRATDSRGYQRHYTYNSYGQIVNEIDNEGGQHQTLYDAGRKVRTLDPLGQATEYFYDSDNNPIGLRDPLGQRMTVSYFNGKPTCFSDKDNTQTRRQYNSKGLLEVLTDAAGQMTRYGYNKQGLIEAVVDPMGHKTQYFWNAQGLLAKTVDARGHKRKFHYDTWGNVVALERFAAGATQGNSSQYRYSETGQILQVTLPDGGSHHYTYNNNDQLVRHSDPQGRTTEFIYDGLSQVIERVDPEGQRLKYQYDTERNLTALINEKGERYQFFYDGNERLIKEIGFDGREQAYAYNAAGHLIQHIDAGEVQTDFKRDALGRMISKHSVSLSLQKISGVTAALDPNNIPPQVTRYGYDAKNRLIETYNNNQYLHFTYNALGCLVKEHHSDLNAQKQRIPASMANIEYTNIWPGMRSSLKLPDGNVVHYGFDKHNLLNGVAFNGQAITHIERDAFGRETTRHQGALSTQTEYDPMGRLHKQTSVNQLNKTQGPIQREYGYDAFGNLSQLTEGDQSTRYIYDLINRLDKVEGDQPEQFLFDPASNLLSNDGQAVGKSEGNRLLMRGDRKFTYDKRGNLIQENRGKEGKLQTRYHYNLDNQLVKVEKDGQTTQYKYDPLGRRISKADAFGKTDYLWAGDQLAQETRNHLKKTYIYEPESFRPVAMVQQEVQQDGEGASAQKGEVFNYHLDHLGTPKQMSNGAGDIVWQAHYTAYGNAAIKIDTLKNPIRFQGQYFDEESGLHYNRHRYYDPSLGQFTTQDPIGLLGGVNNYQYAPNPVGWVDPLGLTCKEGTAEIIMYKAGPQVHFVVEVHHNGTSMVTEQQSSGSFGTPTEIENDDFSGMLGMEPVNIITTKLPDARAAIEYQTIRAGTPDGPYCVDTNSCLTHVFDVLRAGGKQNVPDNSKRLTAGKYIRRLENGE